MMMITALHELSDTNIRIEKSFSQVIWNDWLILFFRLSLFWLPFWNSLFLLMDIMIVIRLNQPSWPNGMTTTFDGPLESLNGSHHLMTWSNQVHVLISVKHQLDQSVSLVKSGPGVDTSGSSEGMIPHLPVCEINPTRSIHATLKRFMHVSIYSFIIIHD